MDERAQNDQEDARRSFEEALGRYIGPIDRSVDAVVRAWVVEGPSPSYHREKKAQLRREWPSLADAVEQLVSATTKSRRGSRG